MKSMISPNFPAQKLEMGKIEDWIDVLEDRIVNWILRPARTLLNISNGDFAITQLLMPYFEGICIYLRGEDSRGRSKPFFKEGFVSVFSPGNFKIELMERIAEILYEDARCGFFHDNMIRSRIFFTKAPGAINPNLPKINGKLDIDGPINAVVIDAENLIREVEGHFNEYLKQLRDEKNPDLRERFKKACEMKWSLYEAPTQIGAFEEYPKERR